ncbi:hypothetical protein [Saccharospirillum alexandrii]|uniref:hypothetical protein n=1 Tax=Saccharospirillum alexandrii TaxID=2448477 RepID=UPI00373603EB
MSLKKIFVINLVIGIFVCLAHIPLVALKLSGVSGFESVNLWQVLPLIPFDLTLLLGAIAALAGSDERKSKILPVHAVILGLLSVVIIGMLLWFVLLGIPEGNFSWSPGLGAALVGYSMHVSKRAFYQGTNKLMANAGWYSAGIVFFFELVLMYKFYVMHFT